MHSQRMVSTSSRLRGLKAVDATPRKEQHRRLAKKGGGSGSGGSGGGSGSGGSSSGDYMGCLNMTSTELKEYWHFWGRAPDCSYVHDESSGDDDGSGNGEEGDYGDDGNYGDESYEQENEEEDGNGDNAFTGDEDATNEGDNVGDDDDDDGNGDGGEGNEGDGDDGGDDYQVVVSNEDVVNNGTIYDVYEDFDIGKVSAKSDDPTSIVIGHTN